jgi:hypothetical protein
MSTRPTQPPPQEVEGRGADVCAGVEDFKGDAGPLS